MKDLALLVWLTQTGLSVAIPPAGFILLAVWLRDSCGWGEWVIWAGVIFGAVGAVNGLRDSLRALQKLTKPKQKQEPPVAFNSHD